MDFVSILVLNSYTDTEHKLNESLLNCLIENELLDKLKYASFILDKFGRKAFLSLGYRLKCFSQVGTLEALKTMIHNIKIGFIKEGISLEAYLDKYFSVEMPLASSPLMLAEKAPQVLTKSNSQAGPGLFQFFSKRDSAEPEMKKSFSPENSSGN